jgi:cysteine desulfurase
MRRVYLDHQATTPVLPAVVEAMMPYFSGQFGSPSSLHELGLHAREALAKARTQVGSLVNAAPEEIIFTSGGTESANLAVKGTAYAQQRRGKHIVISAVEHPAVTNSAEFLEKHGFAVTKVPVNGQGVIDPEDVAKALTDETILICVQHVNHDIGAVQPVNEIGRIANERGITFFVDAVASAGWLPIDTQAMGADLLSVSPHRFGGPKGAGVLYRNRRARLTSLIHGGNQEEGRRAGTENVPAIVGGGLASELAARDLPSRSSKIAELQAELWSGLQERVECIRLNGPPPGTRRSPANLNLSTEFIEGEAQVLLCDVNGIAIGSSTNCVSKSLQVSPVLQAMGLPHSLAQSAVTLSLGTENTREDVGYVLEVFPKVVARLRSLSPTWDDFQHGRLESLIAPKVNPRGRVVAG